MKVILYGASGMIGSRILDELVSRHHEVTAVTRHPSKIARQDVESHAGDVLDARGVAETVRGADAVISATRRSHSTARGCNPIPAKGAAGSACAAISDGRRRRQSGSRSRCSSRRYTTFPTAVDSPRAGPQRRILGAATIGP